MELKTLAITQARMSSTRLPGKVLMEVNNASLLEIHAERLKASAHIDKHIIAISDNVKDDELEAYCKQKKIDYYRGSENDVLDRFYKLAQTLKPQTIIRLTADCPLIDATLVDETINLYTTSQADYVSNTLLTTYPDGMDVEVFSYNALEKAWREATLPSDREHVTPYIWRNSTIKGGHLFTSQNKAFTADYSNYRLTVDEQEDFLLIKQLIENLGTQKSWLEYVTWIEKNNIDINTKFSRNEGYTNSLKKDQA